MHTLLPRRVLWVATPLALLLCCCASLWASGGFSFADYMNEIDKGCPATIQVEGHSMVGVGYDAAIQAVYLHDTWGDYTASMTWGGSYSGMAQWGVTVLRLAPLGDPSIPEPATSALLLVGLVFFCATRRRRAA